MSLVVAQAGSASLQGLSAASRLGVAVLLSLLVSAGLLWGVPDFLEETIRTVRSETLWSFLWGLGVFIALLFLARVLALLPIVGTLLAALTGLVLLVVAYVGQVIVYIHVARLGLEKYGVDSEVATAAGSTVLAVVVSLIPAVGILVSFVVGALGLGAIIRGRTDSEFSIE